MLARNGRIPPAPALRSAATAPAPTPLPPACTLPLQLLQSLRLWGLTPASVFRSPDFTEFVDTHPGGARGLLRHAGTDASEAFAELHSQSIFAAFAPRHVIGRLSPAEATTTAWRGVPPEPRGRDGIEALAGGLEGVSPTMDVLPSPFPHDAFTGSGIESYIHQHSPPQLDFQGRL